KFGDRRVGFEVGRTVGATVGRVIQPLGTVARTDHVAGVVHHRDVFIVVVGDLGNGGVWLRPRERANDDDVAGLEISGGLVDLEVGRAIRGRRRNRGVDAAGTDDVQRIRAGHLIAHSGTNGECRII